MAEQRVTVRSIAWNQVFPSLRLLAALRMALNFKALALASIGVAGTVAGWRLLGQLFAVEGEVAPLAQLGEYGVWPWQRQIPLNSPDALLTLESWYHYSPLLHAWSEIAAPFEAMLNVFHTPTLAGFAYLLCCALWALVVWSFFGGAISRLAAVSFARQENVSLGGLFRFVNPRLGAYFVAPLFPLLGSALVALLMAAVGLVMRADVGLLLAAIIWPLVILGGFVMAFLLLGLFFGFPLMWGAISAEGTDSFGALSHAYSYVYQRPLRYLGYAVVAALAGVLGLLLVNLFISAILEFTRFGISWGSQTDRLNALTGPEPLGTLGNTGAAIIAFWTNCLRTVAYGFVFSYFWTSTTAIYFLLRRLVDAQEIDEVYMPDEQGRRGLPPLKTAADGLPVVEEPAAENSAEARA